jgi:rhodanese-related sulfurtransferase
MQYRVYHVRCLAAMGVLLMGQGCSGGARGTPSDISATELTQTIASGAPPTIIDVRSSREYKRGHVPGARHLPFWRAFGEADQLDAPRDRPVVLYCEHGPRAWIAGFALRRHGFTQVRYLAGHMSGWRRAGMPVQGPGEPDDATRDP